MYTIIQTYNAGTQKTSWMMGDYILFAQGRLIWGIRRYQMAFDVQLSEGEFE